MFSSADADVYDGSGSDDDLIGSEDSFDTGSGGYEDALIVEVTYAQINFVDCAICLGMWRTENGNAFESISLCKIVYVQYFWVCERLKRENTFESMSLFEFRLGIYYL